MTRSGRAPALRADSPSLPPMNRAITSDADAFSADYRPEKNVITLTRIPLFSDNVDAVVTCDRFANLADGLAVLPIPCNPSGLGGGDALLLLYLPLRATPERRRNQHHKRDSRKDD